MELFRVIVMSGFIIGKKVNVHIHVGIPFMGVINGGYHFNVMYINFDTETRKVVGTAIEGPIPVCQKLFENTLDCQFKDEE